MVTATRGGTEAAPEEARQAAERREHPAPERSEPEAEVPEPSAAEATPRPVQPTEAPAVPPDRRGTGRPWNGVDGGEGLRRAEREEEEPMSSGCNASR